MKQPAPARFALFLAGCVLACGCDRTPKAAPAPEPRTPIATGTDVKVDVYDKSVDVLPNQVRYISDGQRVVVYDDYILVTDNAGRTCFIPKGHYANLSFKADAH